MSAILPNVLNLAARGLFVVMFLPAGISKLTGFDNTVSYIAAAGLPMPAVAAAVAMCVEMVGSLAILAGYGTRIAALVLAAFTLMASVFFHAYWAVPADQLYVTQLLFFKNIAIVGGLLALAANSPVGWSLDALCQLKRPETNG